MKLLSTDNQDWVPVDAEEQRTLLDSRLRQLLGAERLLVFAGLGTSRCVTPPEGGSPPPSMSDLWKHAKATAGDALWESALKAAGWQSAFADDIELLLTRCQMAVSLHGDEDLEKFVARCEEQIVSACSFVRPEMELPVHEAFLRRIARRPTRLPRTQLFTTNYDLAFEGAASRTGFAVIDGFSQAAPERFDSGFFEVDYAVRDRERAATPVDWVPNVVHLLKLHGSVDWTTAGADVVREGNPTRPLIVYPRATKFEVSYQQPFLDLMARFQAAVRRPETALLIVGSGLSDRHLVEPILAAIRSNVRLSALVVSPGLAETDNDAVQVMSRYIRGGDRRLALLAATFEELVPVLPDLMPPTEAEQHVERTAS